MFFKEENVYPNINFSYAFVLTHCAYNVFFMGFILSNVKIHCIIFNMESSSFGRYPITTSVFQDIYNRTPGFLRMLSRMSCAEE